ncbi:pyochelin biosynthetic protein PchC [Streptomyces sp. B3I7]|uniref:thioesterase II family protein n=1 Tax=unclassified Streptomyces TaxID=2593676 RepID=UPI00278697A2|nr:MULTISPECIES: alpha/beta fold hydrolase [unclassified Streptomyces]MDQ0784868.1 pyochelin biosynthetic protein PchC [Streptomyces sp. B3I8]MDQ0808647.1 pyochelin biosynthetic protein PchC [Streptomyces sp. B3I7]
MNTRAERSLVIQGDADKADDIVVFLPPAGAVASPYLPIGALLQDTLPAVHCETPGRGRLANEEAPGSVHSAADRWAADLAEIVPGRRLHLFGHSLGALYAYEVTLRLESRPHCEVASLSASGAREPGSTPRSLLATAFAALRTPDQQQGAGEHWMDRDLRMRGEYRTAHQVVRAPLALLCGASDPFATPAEMERWKDFTSGPYLGMFTFRGGHDYYLSGEQAITDVISRVVEHSRHPELIPRSQ